MEEMHHTRFLKDLVAWRIFFWTWYNRLKPNFQLMNFKNLCRCIVNYVFELPCRLLKLSVLVVFVNFIVQLVAFQFN